MYLNIKTGYTFKQVYGHLDQIAEKCARYADFAGIADLGNTFAHIPWRKACKKAGIKPIYGVQLPVVDTLQRKVRRYPFNWMTLIAKDASGLQEIYRLVDLSFQQMYYRQRITYDQINDLSDSVYVLSGVAPRWDLIKRFVNTELSPCTPLSKRKILHTPPVACCDNYYPDATDDIIYEPFADERLLERKTSPIHILTYGEWKDIYNHQQALYNLEAIAKDCNVELPKAPMVKYIGKDNIEKWCKKGAREKNINLSKGLYAERYERELKLIQEKEYVDYFLVVADLIKYAKTKMAVGPARGSSAGSLVCYLMGITEIDPLEYDLYFERFISVNRFDLPDIDIDFQDDKRHLVTKYLERKYGKDCVAQIGNINRMKPKSAITRFAQSLGIPPDDVHELKDAIQERSGGDARANACMEDTFTDTDIGKKFIENYPAMEVVKHIEAHPSHTGVHAAGILVCNKPITDYCGVNSRDKKRIGMLDKKDAEAINLLKIDALGLRTLAIIAGVCDQVGKPYTWMYEIPTDDAGAYKVFNDGRFNGIFQFEGSAVQGLAKQMPINDMEDVAALGALGRPGPLVSGGASSFIGFRNNPERIKYLSDHKSVVDATKGTYGIIIYQEQMLAIGRNYGQLSWADTQELRHAASKSLGDEFFDKYKKNFIKGAMEQGETEEQAKIVWKAMHSFGSWSFNKSHAVSYGLISYLCAYFKAHHPMEFLVSCLNHARDDRTALKILRDAVENDGIKHEYFNPGKSEVEWCVKGDILYGGFMTIHGLGPVKAKKAVKFREEKKMPPKGMLSAIKAAISPFKYLYPAKELYGDYYSDPKSHNLSHGVIPINEADHDGSFTVIGCIIKKNLRDKNEACFVSKRNGKFLDGQTSWLNITIEDDTDSIMCKIKAEDYLRFGKDIAETGKEDKDWYMVHGQKINGWSIIFVKNIMKITRKI